MAKVNFSPKLAGSLISILPRAAAKTFENRSNLGLLFLMLTTRLHRKVTPFVFFLHWAW
jgi:hypothetical protein